MCAVEGEKEGILFIGALPTVTVWATRLGNLVTITKLGRP